MTMKIDEFSTAKFLNCFLNVQNIYENTKSSFLDVRILPLPLVKVSLNSFLLNFNQHDYCQLLSTC